MDEEAPTLRRIRDDLAALGTTRTAQRRALQQVIGWAEHGELTELGPFSEGRVRELVQLAIQRLSDEETVYAGRG